VFASIIPAGGEDTGNRIPEGAHFAQESGLQRSESRRMRKVITGAHELSEGRDYYSMRHRSGAEISKIS
jgi:hypothetical protein